MAAKLGYEAIKYLVKKNMMKRGTGITTIPGESQKLAVAANSESLLKLMQAKGIDTAKVSVKDVEKFINIQNAVNKKSKVISQGHPEFQGITDKLLGKKAKVHPFQGMTPRIQQDVNSIIKDLKNMEPMAAMKEANLIIGRKGKYKNLSGDESQRILKDTDDHIFQRDIQYDEFGEPIKPDPEDMASGGRVPLMYGGDPGFQFEYGGSWADWRDQHQHQMPVTDYIKTKMPKERLPFRDMEEGGIAQLSRPGYFLGGPAAAKKALKEILKKIKNLKKPEDYLMDAGDKLGKYYLKNPTKGADALSAIAAGTLISRHLNRKKNKPDEKASGGLAYMLGEPTYMKYEGGGSVGHAPWLKPSGQPQPQGQNETPTPNVATRPDPMKAPRGLPSVAPKNMDPAFMQQKMMQQAMMGRGPGNTGQGPRTMANAGGRIGYEKGFKVLPKIDITQTGATPAPGIEVDQTDRTFGLSGLLQGDKGYGGIDFQTGNVKVKVQADDNTVFEDTMPKEDLMRLYVGLGQQEGKKVEIGTDTKGNYTLNIKTTFGGPEEMNQGGIMRTGFKKGGDMSRRGFLKLMAGLAALPVVGKYFKAAKLAKPAAAVTETIARGADGMPVYITDLIQVVKAKGTKDIIEGFKRSDYSTVHRYKGVDVVEDGAGNIKIKSDKSGVSTDPYTGKTHEGIAQENHIQIEKGEWIEPTKTKKGIKTQDEYTEGTVYPDRDGKMKDFEDGLDEAIHLDFKKIADEVDTLIIKKTKKASGGLAHMLGE